MFITTALLVWGRALVNAMLAALSARPAAALLATPTVRLFVGDTAPSPDSVFADFTEPTFHGYAPVTLTLAGPVQLGTQATGMIAAANFIATSGGTIDDTVTGYWLTDGVSAVYGAERFADAVEFGAVGDFLDLSVALPVGLYQANPLATAP